MATVNYTLLLNRDAISAHNHELELQDRCCAVEFVMEIKFLSRHTHMHFDLLTLLVLLLLGSLGPTVSLTLRLVVVSLAFVRLRFIPVSMRKR